MWPILNKQHNLSYLMLILNFKILSQGVPEKSLMEKRLLTDKHSSGKGKNYMSHNVRKPTMWSLNRSDTDQAVQLLEMARGLKFVFRK